jgi:hypothetical protein
MSAVGGILDDDPVDNPHFWTYNAVVVPYCTSDFFAGNATQEQVRFHPRGIAHADV